MEPEKITYTMFFSHEYSTNVENIGLWLGVCLHKFLHTEIFLIPTTQHYSRSLSMLNNSCKENPSTQKCSDALFLTDGYFYYYIKFHQQFWDKKSTVRTIIIFHSISSRIGRNQVYFHGCCRQKVKHLILLSIMYFLSHYFCTLTKCKMAKKKKNKLYLYNSQWLI